MLYWEYNFTRVLLCPSQLAPRRAKASYGTTASCWCGLAAWKPGVVVRMSRWLGRAVCPVVACLRVLIFPACCQCAGWKSSQRAGQWKSREATLQVIRKLTEE